MPAAANDLPRLSAAHLFSLAWHFGHMWRNIRGDQRNDFPTLCCTALAENIVMSGTTRIAGTPVEMAQLFFSG
jgi:hypothetical protein